MIRYLTVPTVLAIYERLMAESGGYMALRSLAALESAVLQPQQTFAGVDLYPTLAAKAGALGYALIQNHAFVDGNKRIGHAAMEVFLVLNGYEIAAPVDMQEQFILNVASGVISREALVV